MRIANLAFIFLAASAKADNSGSADCNCNPAEDKGGVWCTQAPLEDLANGNNKGCECYDSSSGSSFTDYCSYTSCCTGIFRNNVPQWQGVKDDRRLKKKETTAKQQQIIREGEEAKYKETVNQCGHYEYETALYVDKHLYAIASPTKEAEAAKCPFVVIHSKFGTGEERPKKEAMVYSNKQDGEAQIAGKTYPMGTFKLSALVHAYETSEPGLDSGFDILTNNCATFMVNLASTLGIKVDTRVTSYVANRLLQEAGSDLMHKIKSSVNYPHFFRNLLRGASSTTTNSMTDQELVHGVVEQHAADLMV